MIADLIARLEAATGPDWELDADIMGALEISMSMVLQVPRYTASLDAALSLVPAGWVWRVQADAHGCAEAWTEKDSGDFGAVNACDTRSFAATPALALCAAALRAREAAQ